MARVQQLDAIGDDVVVYNPNMVVRGGGERVTAALAQHLAAFGRVVLVTNERSDLDAAGRYFSVDLSAVRQVALEDGSRALRALNRLPLPRFVQIAFADALLAESLSTCAPRLFVNNSYRSMLPNPGRAGVYMCMFPQRLQFGGAKAALRSASTSLARVVYRSPRLTADRHEFGSLGYDVITANSRYTQHYIDEYWHQPSTLLYPPCTDMAEDGANRERMILHVGRFDAPSRTAHHKAQDVLIEAFRRMKFLHEQGWTLRLAGSRGRGAHARRHLAKLHRAAEGLPIEFDVDLRYDDLRGLYNRASVYWHATGYGQVAESAPERQEHFGITTVEALSAGCIAVVLDSAGQRECVEDGVNGFRWRTIEDLTDIMRRIAALSDGEVNALRTRARRSAWRFGKAAFTSAVDTLVEELGVTTTSRAQAPKSEGPVQWPQN